MSIDRAHAILGHSSKAKTRETTAALGILITRGALKTCESCAILKAKQKNVNEESTGEKASKYNGRVYHDIATIKESNEDKSLGRKTVWHISAEETVNFKRSKFFRAKSDMPKDMCPFMQQEMSRGYPISIIRQDNASENKKLVTLAYSQEWKLATAFENTDSQDTSAKFSSRECFHGDSVEDESGDECSSNTKKRALQIVG